MDNMTDVAEGAKIISSLGVDQVKCHSMYILKDTELGNQYEKGEIMPVPVDEFIERTITFLEQLDPGIIVQRLLGRAPEERCLFCNWGMSWWKIRDQIEEKMVHEGRYQGRLYRLLRESACYD
jgi:radical SAM superfamily enzyme